jgi:hypothetical protein
VTASAGTAATTPPARRSPKAATRQVLRRHGRLFLLLCTVVTLLFVLRQVPLTSDDEFYIDYFAEYREFGDVLLFALIDEPLFKLYTNFLHAVLPTQASLRVLILMTILPHLVVAWRLGGWRAPAYVIGYFTFVELAPHLSWVQLRQGLAVGLLFLLLHLSRERLSSLWVAAIGLIHTSMLVLLPCFMITTLPRRLAYLLIAALAVGLLATPDLVGQLSFLLGRRESAYLDEDPTYSFSYVLYSLVLVAYVSKLASDGRNRDQLLIYHAMCALVLPMFFMTTFGAFAERLYFVVRWYELALVVQSRRPKAAVVAVGYLALNLAYTAYHSLVNFGNGGGVLERYIQLVTP